MIPFGESMMNNDIFRPMLLACLHVGLGEKGEDVIDCIREVISNGKVYFKMWSKECECLHPLFVHDIPGQETFSLSN